MSKTQKNISFLIMVSVAGLPFTVKAEEPVYFADANLKSTVEEALGVTDPTPTDMLGLTRTFYAGHKGISDLTGIEYATNIERLEIRNNLISDISPLYGLTNLRNLHLENNQISNIPLLPGLKNLRELYLQNNQVRDITGLSGFTNLSGSNLDNNQINDLSPVSGLTNLIWLSLNNNQVSDISVLSELTRLERLSFKKNQIKHIPLFPKLTKLWALGLSGNQISDLSPLTVLPGLKLLGLNNIQNSNIQPLSEITSLKYLLLNNNQISDLSPLSGLTSLNELDLNNNQISDLSQLSGLTSLKHLYLSNNQISDISLLTTFMDLKVLKIQKNPLGIDAYNIHIIELRNRGITVVYDPPICTLSSRSTTGGSITTPGEGFYPYDHGTTITLKAIPQEPHYHFVNWTGTAVDASRVADPDVANTTAIIYSDYTLRANFKLQETGPEKIRSVLYVDDDAPDDREANNPEVSDPDEDGSPEHPYDTIQEGIDAAVDSETVIVAPGTYTGDGNRNIDFKGKAITVKSEKGPTTCIIDCQSYYYYDNEGVHEADHRGFYLHNGEDANSVVQGFTITNGLRMRHESGGGILCDNSSPRIVDCIVVGNEARKGGGIATINSTAQIIDCKIKENTAYDGGGIEIGSQDDGVVLIKGCIITGNHAVSHPRFGGCGGGIIVCSFSNIVNCTITGNRAGYSGGGICFRYGAPVSNSIIWGNTINMPFGDGDNIGLQHSYESQRILPHVFIENSLVGSGNENDFSLISDSNKRLDGQWLEGDPCFANIGYWDPNGTPNNINDDFWVDGDYHLKSLSGRWTSTNSGDPTANNQNWILDDITSPCIDAGDPNSPVGDEPLPNGGRINMGAYGGTVEASKS